MAVCQLISHRPDRVYAFRADKKTCLKRVLVQRLLIKENTVYSGHKISITVIAIDNIKCRLTDNIFQNSAAD